MRILFISNSPLATSGYGQQAALTGAMLEELGADVWYFANYKVADELEFEGKPVYGTNDNTNLYKGLSEVANSYKFDLIVILADPWVFVDTRFPHYKDEFYSLLESKVPVAFWAPIDCEYLSPYDAFVLSQCSATLALSRHGEREAQRAGLNTFLIPHAIDCSVFDIMEVEAPVENPIIGMIQANTGTRKLIALQLEAFALARQKCPDIVLYVHADLKSCENQLSLDYLPALQFFGIEDVVFDIPCEAPPTPPSQMARLYNTFFMLLHTTAAEGFGLPIIEAMACGVQPVVSNNSAPSTLHYADKVETVVREYMYHLSSFHSWPSARRIAARIEFWYNYRDRYRDIYHPHRKLLRDYALNFDRNHVRDFYWKPFLEKVAA